MKIALAQLNYHIGNFESNQYKVIEAITSAKKLGAELIVFAELAISGYPPRDFLSFEDFIEECEKSIQEIAKHCKGIAAIVGAPSINTGEGKKLWNTAYFLEAGQVKSQHHKNLLPTYDIFDENRYFEAGSNPTCIQFQGKKIALTICEDLWNVGGQPKYKYSPMDELINENPDIIINIAASPFSQHQAKNRQEVFKLNAQKYKLPIYYVNHVGAQTELIFDGGSCAVNEKGEIIQQLPYFEESIQLLDSSVNQKIVSSEVPSKYERIESALVLGIKDYFKKLGFKKATLGLSGGIDSALTLVLAVKALGKEYVIPILMPSQFSSDHSIDDSIELCENLGCQHHIIEIESIYQAFEKQLDPLFKGTEFGIAEENIQSRSRGALLMAHTNKFGTILLNTSNKSELAVGYGTLYGDMSGGISVLGDLYKTEVFELSKHLNRNAEIIPSNIITKPPSAELRPDQKDSDSLPDYEILDAILKEYIEHELSPAKIIAKGFDAALVKRVLKMVNI